MAIVEILLSVTVPLLFGAGMTLASMSLTHRWEPLVARICFVVAGFLVTGLVLRWLTDVDWPALQRGLVGLAIIAPTIVITVWSVRWVGFRARAVAATGNLNITSHSQTGGITAHTVKGIQNV